MATAGELLALARGEIGVKESPAGSNRVKYNTAYYGREVSGPSYPWCAVFLWWLFRRVGSPELYYGGEQTAYVPALLAWARREGLIVTTPMPGDLVCFDFNGNGAPDHVGLCESFDGAFVTTIDGNTSPASDANGGAVMRRRRHRRYIAAVIRPQYEEEEDTVTQEQFDAMMEDYLERLAKKEPSGWSEEQRTWAEANGILSGDEDGSKKYKKFATREELVAILRNFARWVMDQRG